MLMGVYHILSGLDDNAEQSIYMTALSTLYIYAGQPVSFVEVPLTLSRVGCAGWTATVPLACAG